MPVLPRKLNVLILQAGLDLTIRIRAELDKTGFQPVFLQASSEDELDRVFCPDLDIVLSIDSGEGITAPRARQLLLERGLDIPIIAIGEQADEERAVNYLRQGVTEYLYQDQLPRLSWVVRRALGTNGQGGGSGQIPPEFRRVFAQGNSPRHILNTVLDGLEEAVFIVEVASRRVVECNAAVETILGYTPQEMIGNTAERFLKQPEVYSALIGQVKSALDSDGVFKSEHWLSRKTGEMICVDLNVSQICDEHGQRVGLVVSLHDVTERIKINQDLKEQEHQLDQLIQQMPLPMVVGEMDGTVQVVNNAFLNMFGISKEAEFRSRFNPLTDSFVASKGLTSFVERVKQGAVVFIPEIELNPSPEWSTSYGRGFTSRVYTDLTMFPVLRDNGEIWRMVSIWNDVTRRKQVEQEMVRRLAELQALQSVAMAAANAASLPELVERVSEIVGAELYPDSFGIALVDEEKGFLNHHMVTRLPQTGEPMFPVNINLGITGAVARSAKPRRVADVRDDPDYLPRFDAIQSELCVPILCGERVIGVIDVEAVHLNAFSESDERLLVTIAGELGTAIEKLRSLEAERVRNLELEALAQMSAAVRIAETREDMCPAVLERIIVTLNAQGGAIAFRDPENGALLFDVARGESQGMQGQRIPAGEGFGAQVIVSQQYAICADMHADPTVFQSDQIDQPRCMLCLPVLAEGQTIGLVYLTRETVFEASDIRLTQSMVDIFASAVYRIQLQEQTHQQLQRLSSLRKIDESILSSPDIRHTLAVLHDQISRSLQVDGVEILLYDPASQTLSYKIEDGLPPVLHKEVLLKLGESHAGRIALERKVEFIPDLRQIQDSLTQTIGEIEETYISYLGIPLVSKGELKGVLEIFHRTPLEPNPDWMSYVEALAGQAAIAIDNAQLFREQEEMNERLIRAYDATLDGWSHALDLRDRETEGHSHRVTELTITLARRLGVPEEELPHIRRGAQLHDIGKMGIPDSILLKPGPLTEEEWVIMRQHPLYAADMLYPIEFLQPALDIPYCHHEKWDGSGYPQGLTAEEIPLSARIFAVVDVWDALTSKRSYRPAWSTAQALKHIRNQSGKHFDPRVVEGFMGMIGEYFAQAPAGNRDLRYFAMDD